VTNTGKLVTEIYGASVPASVTKSTNIINSIATKIIASKSASEISTLATDAQPDIAQVQSVIEGDNEIINQSVVQGLIPAQAIDERAIIISLYSTSQSPPERLKLAQSLSSEISLPIGLSNKQQLVEDAIKNIVGANQALSAKQYKSALDLINEAVATANLASTTDKSSTPKK